MDADDMFGLNSEDDALYATIDLGDESLGGPIDFEEGAQGAPVVVEEPPPPPPPQMRAGAGAQGQAAGGEPRMTRLEIIEAALRQQQEGMGGAQAPPQANPPQGRGPAGQGKGGFSFPTGAVRISSALDGALC